MQSCITLYEHERVPYSWTPAEERFLDRLNATGNPPLRAVYQAGSRSLQAAQHVGVVRMGTRTIQILPKMYRTATNTAARVHEATANVLYLLHYAGQLPISEHAIAALSARNSDWFELLTYLIASHLQTAWHRGPARTYQRVNAAQTALKGKLRIADQLRRPGRNHLFALTFDEFTADTPLNRMLRFVVERLWRLTCSIANRRILADLRGWMDEVTLLPALSAADIEQVAIDRLNSRYAPLLTLAKLFLEQQAIQLAGGDTPSFAFTFDMNRLFEGFIAGFLVRYRAAILPEAMRHCQIHVQAHGMTHVLAICRHNGMLSTCARYCAALWFRHPDHDRYKIQIAQPIR